MERDQERLGGDVVGQRPGEPPLGIAVDRRVVAVEQLGEALRLP
ncbi:hypothetical protein [Nonomuraea sp. NEAU-A123]|nr:hypothetical protein [Nonomuraea sp. NEAU-A123]